LGTYFIGTGYKAVLHLNDVTITDNESISAIICDLNNGVTPDLSFRGAYRRRDGLAERIIFRQCLLAGDIDVVGLTQGFVWDLDLAINSLTDEHVKKFQTHG
jgi:hypothetical protein